MLDLAEEDDPYAKQSSGKLVDDMSKWPAVEYGNIFATSSRVPEFTPGVI